MAKQDPQTLAERLFTTFLGPLVVGGSLRPGKLIGGQRALGLGDGRAPSDVDLLSQCELARVRVARKLAPVDTFDPAPSGSEWALAAVLHDLVQATHPDFDAVFRRSGPKRILDVAEATLERVTPAASVGDALSRHTWLSRMFEITRTDVDVRWWTGSERFLGSEPPSRLIAWPELRRVKQTRTPRPLMELPTSGGAVDPSRFAAVVKRFLTKTPLTDLATLGRTSPGFVWTREALSFAGAHAGRTLATRALAVLPEHAVDAALGRATRELFASRSARALLVAIDVLRDRALMTAAARLRDEPLRPLEPATDEGHAAFAVGAGALAASQWITQSGGGFDEGGRRALLRVLAPAASSTAAKAVGALLTDRQAP